MKKFILNQDWQLKLLNSHDDDIPIDNSSIIPATVPGTVHTDLLNSGLIDEPYYADNELKLKWIDLCDWSYSMQFDISPEIDLSKQVHIVFEGLDTVADIILNGKLIGSVKNMFLKYEYEVRSLLNYTGNSLELKFYSAKRYTLNEQEKYGKIPVPASTDSDRVYLRKAQYSYGWDWGPAFTTMGIWRDVYLQQKHAAAIQDVKFDTVSINDNNAECELFFSVEGIDENSFKSRVDILDRSGKSTFSYDIECMPINHLNIPLDNINIWWPNGLGSAYLYTLKISLIDENDKTLNQWMHKIGIRMVELYLEENGSPSFRFIVNGQSVYIKGVNWIPGDSFLPRVSYEKYSRLLNLAKDASMNMVRVWGGGIYENNEFYDLCDELGLLVWQDCMFACGSYPEHEEFIESVKNEIEYNLDRIRNHASLALLCGNNENEWIWTMDHDSHYDEMPGYKIYHELIPDISQRVCPQLPYWPSSPFGLDKDPNSQTSGNRHQWYIWSGWKDYSEVVNDNSLFISEFGFQGPANKDTFKMFLPAECLKVHDRVFEFHNKQIEGPERVIKFLSGHLPLPSSWDEFIYLAQLNQGFALKTCLEHWRGNQPTTSGSIIWQINDTWPVTSWALVDSEEQPKLSYHFVKRAFNKELLTFHRSDKLLEVIIINENEKVEGKVVTKLYEAGGAEILKEWSSPVDCSAAIRSDILEIDTDRIEKRIDWLIVSTLYDANGNIASRNYYTEKRWKDYKLPAANINITHGSDLLILSTDKPAFFVDLYHPGITFLERGMIILPEENMSVKYDKLNASEPDLSKIKIYTLNDFLFDS